MSDFDDDSRADGATFGRRTLLKRAAVAGGAAWTAPLILESLLSPAAAESAVAPTVTASTWGWAKSSVIPPTPGVDRGVKVLTTDTGTTTNAGTGQPSASAGGGAQGFGNLTGTAGQLVVILVGVGDDDNLSAAPAVTSPAFGTTTQILPLANTPFGATSPPNLRMYAFWARATDSPGIVTVTFANPVRAASVIAATISGGGPAAYPTPIGSSGSAAGTASNPSFDAGAGPFSFSDRTMVLFGMLQEPFTGLTAGEGGSGGVQWASVNAANFGAPVRQVLVTSANGGTTNGDAQQHRLAMFYGNPTVSTTTANLSPVPVVFPSVESQTSSQVTTAGTSHPVSMPSGITAGDLLLVFATFEGNIVPGAPGGGWNAVYSDKSQANTVGGVCYYKVAAGGDSLTFTSASTRSAHVAHRIANFQRAPASLTDKSIDGGTVNPNSPSLTSGFGAVNTLWFSAAHAVNFTTSGYPTNYGLSQLTKNATGATVAVAARNLNAATENPGGYTISASQRWLAATVAIRPVVALNWGTFAFEVMGDNP